MMKQKSNFPSFLSDWGLCCHCECEGFYQPAFPLGSASPLPTEQKNISTSCKQSDIFTLHPNSRQVLLLVLGSDGGEARTFHTLKVPLQTSSCQPQGDSVWP